MKQTIKEKLREIIRENLVDDLNEEVYTQDNAQFIDLGFDSYLMMMLFALIEEEFNITIEDEDLALDFEKVENMVEFISYKLKG